MNIFVAAGFIAIPVAVVVIGVALCARRAVKAVIEEEYDARES